MPLGLLGVREIDHIVEDQHVQRVGRREVAGVDGEVGCCRELEALTGRRTLVRLDIVHARQVVAAHGVAHRQAHGVVARSCIGVVWVLQGGETAVAKVPGPGCGCAAGRVGKRNHQGRVARERRTGKTSAGCNRSGLNRAVVDHKGKVLVGAVRVAWDSIAPDRSAIHRDAEGARDACGQED